MQHSRRTRARISRFVTGRDGRGRRSIRGGELRYDQNGRHAAQDADVSRPARAGWRHRIGMREKRLSTYLVFTTNSAA